MTFYNGCPQKAVERCEFPVVVGAAIGTGYAFVLCAIVHQTSDTCVNARGKVQSSLFKLFMVRGMLVFKLLADERCHMGKAVLMLVCCMRHIRSRMWSALADA